MFRLKGNCPHGDGGYGIWEILPNLCRKVYSMHCLQFFYIGEIVKKKSKQKKVKKQSSSQLVWSLKILLLSFALSLGFGVLSELVLSKSGVFVLVLIIYSFIYFVKYYSSFY